MKKIIALILATLTVFACVACGNTNDNNTETVDVENSLELLNTILSAMPEEKRFSVNGGFGDEINYTGAGNIDLSNEEARATLAFQFYAAPEVLANVDNAANALGRIANNFTGAAFHVTNGDTQALADAIKAAIEGNTMWTCGFPEKLVVLSIGDYVVAAFGLAGLSDPEADFIGTFTEAAKAAYSSATVVVEYTIL